jgi:hypothetical protein
MLQWEDRLAAAESPDEVLFVASDFLASLDYFDIARLPSACRPRPLTRAADLWSFMADLVTCAATSDRGPASANLIVRLLMFFSRAAERLDALDRAVQARAPAKRSA